jgi:hypothetical protein
MAAIRRGLRRNYSLFLVALILANSGWSPERLCAQSQTEPTSPRVVSSGQEVSPGATVRLTSAAPPAMTPQAGGSGTGLTIIPTFNANIDAATQAAINNAIAFYQNTFTNNITINIEFHNMSTGLGQSVAFVFNVPYATYHAALQGNATSTDDVTALANTPSGSTNPINGNANIGLKSPTGRAIGLNTPEQSFNFPGSPCPTFTGSGCIGLNVTLANSIGNLTATVEHEIDEVLGLGSALNGTTTPATPAVEDLFRWASAGVRSYSANTSTANPCVSTPAAFFSIDGGVTNLNQFNNCNNGGDYGDWITHTPPQVQDAFTNGTGSASLTNTSSEVRALDVIGFSIVSKHRRGQLVTQ